MKSQLSRFNLWCIAPGHAAVVAFDHDRAELEALIPDQLPFPEDGIRFEVLPDCAEPELLRHAHLDGV